MQRLLFALSLTGGLLLVSALSFSSVQSIRSAPAAIVSAAGDENEACAAELRRLRATLTGIADTATVGSRNSQLADSSLSIISVMLGQLTQPTVHLQEQWLSTFQDLNALIALPVVRGRRRPLETLYHELKSKLSSAPKTAGNLTEKNGFAFQRMAQVIIRGRTSSSYKPIYRVCYRSCEEDRMPIHQLAITCTSDADCPVDLTPSYYVLWAVDPAKQGRVCSDTSRTFLYPGVANKVDLLIK